MYPVKNPFERFYELHVFDTTATAAVTPHAVIPLPGVSSPLIQVDDGFI